MGFSRYIVNWCLSSSGQKFDDWCLKSRVQALCVLGGLWPAAESRQCGAASVTWLNSEHFARCVLVTAGFTTIAGQSLANELVPLLEPERRAVRNALLSHDLPRVIETMRAALRRLDERIGEAICSSRMQPACAKVCSWCCHGVKVNVSPLEAIVIAHALVQAASVLRERVLESATRRRPMNTDALFEAGDPCPFLGAQGECAIYSVRPSACRRHCCMDATECESAVSNPKLKLAVTQHAAANLAGAINAMAWAAATDDAKLDYRSFELATAVATALRPGVAERWLHGDCVFDVALREVDREDRAIRDAEL